MEGWIKKFLPPIHRG